MTSSHKIHIVAIPGSVQKGSLTAKALDLVVDEFKKHKNVTVEVFNPADISLPMPGREGDASTAALKNAVTRATGIVLATPEYHGSYSSVIKLVIENLDYPSVLAGKPVGLLGVASGQIGAIKALEHLRSVCSHIGAIVLPTAVSVAGVHKLFDEQGHCRDKGVERRIRSLADSLVNYIHNHITPKLAMEELVRGKDNG